MEMPKIAKCEVEQCAYNRDHACHAPAITVGDSSHPMCDTFVNSKQRGGSAGVQGTVGACKVSICSYNEMLECHAPKISVQHHQDHADCATFNPQHK
jgi:hypothetical protein